MSDTATVNFNDSTRDIQYAWGPKKWTRNSSGNYAWSSATGSDYEAINTALRSLFDANSSIYRPRPRDGNWDPYYTGSYIVAGLLKPHHVYKKHVDRIVRKNPHFSESVRNGSIVVADFDSDFDIEISVPPPSSDVVEYRGYRYLNATNVLTTVPDPSNSRQDCFTVNGVIYSQARINYPIVRVGRTFIDTDDCDYSPDEHIERIIERWHNLKPDGVTVQSSLASANEGQYAILATLAEIPEGLIQALSGVKTCLKMYKEAKQKEVRLHNRLNRLRAIANPTLAVRKQVKELADATADVWLTYRLAIKPTVGAIEDWLALDLNPDLPLFIRYRETLLSDLDVSYTGSSSATISLVERAFIKRRYDTFVASLGWGSLSAVWELVPLSFVIDRFVAIGDFITAHTTPNLSVIQGATYSWKVSGGTKLNVCNKAVTISVSGYKRRVINPSHYCGLSYPEDRSTEQSLDHLALAWKIFLGDIFTHKRAGT